MAESLPPPAKKRAAPLAKVTAKERVKQFPAELYEDGGVLFCRFCDHSVDFVQLDTIKDHCGVTQPVFCQSYHRCKTGLADQ